jgi:hypothetical protein
MAGQRTYQSLKFYTISEFIIWDRILRKVFEPGVDDAGPQNQLHKDCIVIVIHTYGREYLTKQCEKSNTRMVWCRPSLFAMRCWNSAPLPALR